jgi:alkanesulfonate monooxygenase SsuD/methylene tetrahydromethanopterin reductase-like flavin-dependent oxidoreductase (luciferase family)
MRYGIEVVPLGDFGSPRVVMQLAEAAEAAGWEALFVWDHLGCVWGVPAGDPFVILSAVATCTKSLRLGTAVTPLPRRRPQILAHALASLDILSQGRLIFGAGLGGVPAEYTAFGETGDARTRAAMLDEGLDVLNRLMSGQPVTHHGRFYTVDGITMAPLPLQRPRVPIWIGGESKPALRRAARWDGWVIGAGDDRGNMVKSPEQLAIQVEHIHLHRTHEDAFDVAMTGYSKANNGPLTREYEEAGATWWLESVHLQRGTFDEMKSRIAEGPPR